MPALKPQSASATLKPLGTIPRDIFEQNEEQRELAESNRIIEQRENRRADKISRALSDKTWIGDARPSDIIPRKILDGMSLRNNGKELEELPKYHFTRHYPISHFVVDLFYTDKEYAEGSVDEKRKWVKQISEKYSLGLKYGAVGPKQHLVDLIEQLDIK